MVIERAYQITGISAALSRQQFANSAFQIRGSFLKQVLHHLTCGRTYETQQQIDEDHAYGYIENRGIEHLASPLIPLCWRDQLGWQDRVFICEITPRDAADKQVLGQAPYTLASHDCQGNIWLIYLIH
jgi:hypothetical protein